MNLYLTPQLLNFYEMEYKNMRWCQKKGTAEMSRPLGNSRLFGKCDYFTIVFLPLMM